CPGGGVGCVRGGRIVGVDGELPDDEGCEQEQSRFDRAGVREGHLDWPAAPTLAVDEDELAFALGERVALAPAAGRPERELAAAPAECAASAQVSRYELADDGAYCFRGLHDALPQPATG